MLSLKCLIQNRQIHTKKSKIVVARDRVQQEIGRYWSKTTNFQLYKVNKSTWPETKPMLLALEVHSLNHCTTKEVSIGGLFEVYFHILIWELSSTSVLLYQLVIRAPMVLQVLAEGKVLVQYWWMTQVLDYQPMQRTWAPWPFLCQPCMRFIRLTVYCSWSYD